MEIYIEYVLMDNLVINYLVLLLTQRTLKLKTSFLRMFLSSMLGTIVAIVMPLLKVPGIVFVIVKILLGIFMVLILTKFYRLKDFIFSFLCFVGYTLFLIGASMATLLAFGTSLEELSQGGYNIAVPLGIIFLIVAFYVYVIVGTAKYMSRKKEMEPFIKNIKLYINNQELELKGFVDSGNKLIDKKTGLPIIIISINSLSRYFSKESLENLVFENGSSGEFKNVHLVPYNTISGEARKMVVFEADKMIIKSNQDEYTTNRFMLGLTYKTFNDAVRYDLLLSNSFV